MGERPEYNGFVKLKPLIMLILIVALPLALLGWVGVRLTRHEQQQIEQQMRELLTDRLRDMDRRVAAHFQELSQEMHRLTAIDVFDRDALRQVSREDARVLQIFVIQPDGNLLYPDPLGTLNRNEQEFLTRAAQIISDRELQRAAASLGVESPATSSLQASNQTKLPSEPPSTALSQSGWFVWYWGRGLNLVFWQRRSSGHIVAAALDRARWIADLIAVLPDTPSQLPGSTGVQTLSRIRLLDSTSKPVYQWGSFEPPVGATAASEISLSPPLSAWRLQQFVPAERLARRTMSGVYFNITTALAVGALGLIALACYFYREYARDIREASQRVSFVNQVSHELRTPLTNIRMYADLLESDLDGLPDEAAVKPRSRLDVIQLESQRLSRLIGNVLTFARHQRKALRLSLTPCCVDHVVQDVLTRFRPSLQQLGVRCEFLPGAAQRVKADVDALEQILGNLINNVEKYAADGKWLSIKTRQQHGRTVILVADRGPGVAPPVREAVFQPFWRGDHSVSGVAGTGIGLSIARELARMHGGDVTLLESEHGALFQVELATPDAGRGDVDCTS